MSASLINHHKTSVENMYILGQMDLLIHSSANTGKLGQSWGCSLCRLHTRSQTSSSSLPHDNICNSNWILDFGQSLRNRSHLDNFAILNLGFNNIPLIHYAYHFHPPLSIRPPSCLIHHQTIHTQKSVCDIC